MLQLSCCKVLHRCSCCKPLHAILSAHETVYAGHVSGCVCSALQGQQTVSILVARPKITWGFQMCSTQLMHRSEKFGRPRMFLA